VLIGDGLFAMDPFQDIPFAWLILLFVLGAVTFTLSTISGGGGAMMQIPVLNFFLGTAQTAPLINLGAFISRPSRIIIFWKHIVWKVFWYYVPAAISGAILAGYLFSKVRISWVQLLVGIFLVSTIFQYRFGKQPRSFHVEYWHFIPLGLFVSVVGTFTGGMGPVLNPFFLNAGITKEELIGTKAAQSFFMGLAQIGSYSFFGLLEGNMWLMGLSLGLGATLGNFIGKRLLAKMSKRHFRQWVITFMVISGLLLIAKALF